MGYEELTGLTHGQLANAIVTISEELGREARERGWCTSYEAFCGRVNGRIGFDAISPCKRMVTVAVTFTAPRHWGEHGLHHAMHDAVMGHAGSYGDGIGDISIHVDVDGEHGAEPERAEAPVENVVA